MDRHSRAVSGEQIPADPADSRSQYAAAQQDGNAARLEPPMMTAASAPAITMETKKGAAPPPGRRRSVGAGAQQLRSPAVKRPASAPVTLQGWLHKQGSDGLMLWKRRWFVLSEYCLFYYKGPEEEKLLGSILLPSYKVGPCTADDRVYRKFAFKAEHANMRTYCFAADSRELMVQWMNALSLATILQEGSGGGASGDERPPARAAPPPAQPPPPGSEDSDSGFPGCRPRAPDKARPPPRQPVYANAPPKPRRLEPDDYGGAATGPVPSRAAPAERRTPDTYARSGSATPAGRPRAVAGDYEDVYGCDPVGGSEASVTHVYRRPSGQVAYIKGAGPPLTAPHRPGRPGIVAYPPPGTPPHYVVTPVHQSPHLHPPHHHLHAHQQPPPAPAVAGRHPPRPHSADFLDYDARRYHQHQQGYHTTPPHGRLREQQHPAQRAAAAARLQRPKSSLDVAPPPETLGDGYYWSEELYAQKMRQSASYLHHAPVIMYQRNQSSSSRATTPSIRLGTPLGMSPMPPVDAGEPPHQTSGLQVPGGSVMNSDVVLRHPKRTTTTSTSTDLAQEEVPVSCSPSRQQLVQQRRWSEYADPRGPDGQFLRSASARLPRQKFPGEEDEEEEPVPAEELKQKSTTDVREGDRKVQQREESMKRLLEWKQRMLQSPLTRKPSGSSARGVAQNELSKMYKQQVLRELASQEAVQARLRDEPSPSRNSREEVQLRGSRRRTMQQEDLGVGTTSALHAPRGLSGRSRSQDGRRSSTSVSRYNSYSSDDEEMGDVRKARKRIRRPSQAGRSRQGSVEGKPSRRHPSVPPHTASRSAPSYENVAASKGHSRVETSEVRKLRSPVLPPEEIPPDAEYGDQKSLVSGVLTKPKNKHGSSSERVHHEQTLSPGAKYRKQKDASSTKNENAPYISPLRPKKYPDAYLRSGSSSRKSTGDVSYPGIQDDRCSNGKHSDSGYDTLQAGRILPGEKDQVDLLTHHWPQVNHRRNDQFVYPAHWNTHRKNEKWNSKLEEGHLVKEYTYEYISSGNEKQDSKTETAPSKSEILPPQNIVQDKIKTFEEEKDSNSKPPLLSKETFELQEPLKMSPPLYHPNEAHVSSLKNADNLVDKVENVAGSSHTSRSELHNFVFGRTSESVKDTATFGTNDASQTINTKCKSLANAKSVKDLLADFEHKSQLLKEVQDNERGEEKRFVFSDTETLLYDTSSDVEGGTTAKACSDDDKDDEVAAALGGRKEKFQSACRDLGRGHSKTDSDDLEVIMTPGFLRLSMAESMVTHENSDSTCTTPTNKKDNTTVVEEHYVPMTPSKKAVLAPPDVFGITKSPSASQTIIMENIFGFGAEYEESSYVEMTEEGIVKSLLAPENDVALISKLDLKRLNSGDSTGAYSMPESPRYCEIETLDKEYSGSASHYELLYRSTSHYEPVYMEVSPVTDSLKVRDLDAKKMSKSEAEKCSPPGKSHEKSKTNACEDNSKQSPPTPPRLSLPDILNSSSTLMQNKHSGEIDQDSSDADDEASKDLDSLDAPRHPRFSLSDTFRPASYYLGASRAMMVLGGISSIDHQDSSDSDLVSPPPIPTSPPPIDELDNSLELQDSSLDDKKQLSSLGASEKFSKDLKRCQSGSLNEVHSSGSETVEVRHPDNGTSTAYLRKRRPVSGDIIGSLDEFHQFSCSDQRSSDLDSIGSRTGLAVDLEDQLSLDIDTYLEDLQTRDIYSVESYLSDGNYSYSRSYASELLGRRESPLNDSVKSMDVKSRDFFSDARQQREIFSSPKMLSMDTSFITARESKISPSPRRQLVDIPLDDDVHYENLHIIPPPPEHSNKFGGEQQRPVTGDELYPRPLSKLDHVNITMHDDEEQLDQQQAGAPYYYSDLLKIDDDGFTSSASEKSLSSTRCVMGYPYAAAVCQPLNNQRGQMFEGSKRNDIGRKVNPIQRSADDENRRLAEELRTTSAHFLGAADKSGQVDQRNIYQADTLKRRKSRTLEQNATSLHPLYAVDKSGCVDQRNVYHGDTLQRRKAQTPDCLQATTNTTNVYPCSSQDKSQTVTQRRSRSLEGLVDDYRRTSPAPEPPPPLIEDPNEGGELWEEDALWRESLRRVSLRHTRSLDNLDGGRERQKVTREVTYVNDRMAKYREERRRDCEEEDRVWNQEVAKFPEEGGGSSSSNGPFLGEGGPPPAAECFEIDRETLRQWDLMSSAPMLGSGARGGGLARVGGPGNLQLPQHGADLDENRPPSSTASGSGSVIGRDPLPPRSVSVASLQQPQTATPPPPPPPPPPSAAGETPPPPPQEQPQAKAAGQAGPEQVDQPDTPGKKVAAGPWNLNVSAGELLGRTHEELVLLLIQLRRQSAGVCKAMEACHVEIEAQARLAELDAPRRMEHLQKLEELKKHLLDLEKQYEKGKPLVNLVDNMVKLGSLYRGGGAPPPGAESPAVRDRLEFNQKVQEQRLLAQERRDWDRLSPDQAQLQAKVQELYRLDRLLQEESATLQSLQQDKELLEKALSGLRSKLQGSRANPAEAERYRKQQRLLEKELSRIRLLLAHNSKKLEETVAENARLEQELVVLRQKWQASRWGVSPAAAALVTPTHHRLGRGPPAGPTAVLEAELRRVQQLVGDLQRQRQELSMQVRQLTEKSHSLVRQIRPGPTGVAGAGPVPGRKRHHSTWLETDLDSLETRDRGLDSSPGSPQHAVAPPSPDTGRIPAPLYANVDRRPGPASYDGYMNGHDMDVIPPPLPTPPEMPPDYPPPPPPPPPPSEEALLNGQHYCTQLDINEADDRMKRFYGIIPREKQQEIKTVRIVKRESERRQRDRDRSGNIGIPITNGSAGTGGKRVTIAGDAGEIVTSPHIEKTHLGRVVEEEPSAAELEPVPMSVAYPEDDPVMAQFQRSMSLPRGFGKRPPTVPPPPPVRVPSPRSDSVSALRNLVLSRHRFESCSGGSSTSISSSAESQRTASPRPPLSAREQLFGEDAFAPAPSPQLSPVFKSEAARAIILEVSDRAAGRRAVPREKRRHHTVSSARLLLDGESAYMGSARSCDDLDMERALRPRLNTPDVVRSTMSHKDFKYNENTIDSILGTPNKIVIPERYIPEQAPELSAEEQLQRMKKAESIRKMLSETSAVTTGDAKDGEEEKSSTLKKKLAAEKKQREHLLQLNQILAKQVMEKSKIVAVKALATLPLNTEPSFDEDDLSPVQPLPLFQQRENFYS